MSKKIENLSFEESLNYLDSIIKELESNDITLEESLKKSGILVRNMKAKELIEGSLRVTIGTTDQMQRFWEVFKKVDSD